MSLLEANKTTRVTERTPYFKPGTAGIVILADAQAYSGTGGGDQAKIYFQVEEARATVPGAEVNPAGSPVCLHFQHLENARDPKKDQRPHLFRAVSEISGIQPNDVERRGKALKLGFNLDSTGKYTEPGKVSPWRGRKYNFVAEGKPGDRFASVFLSEVQYQDEKAEIPANRAKLDALTE